MKDIIIIGSGALGQETAWLIEEINEKTAEWNLLGFLDDYQFDKKKDILGYPILGKYEDAVKYKESYFVVTFGDPRVRKRIIESFSDFPLKWANLYSPTVRIHPSNHIGKGVVIGRFTDLTVNCHIDDFVFLNIHVVLGHEVKVGKYSIISPNVTVNGGGTIGQACQIGANAFLKDITVGDFSTIAASSCVVKNVETSTIVAGVPAKEIKKGLPNKSISRSDR